MIDQDLKAMYQRGLDALNRADFPAATELLSEVVVEDPGNADAWSNLGLCYLETGQHENALEALARALKAEPRHVTAHYLLGNACGATAQLEKAAACYRRALEIDPQHSKAEELLIKTESLLESRDHYRNGLKLLYSAEPTVEDLNRAMRELVQSAAIFEESPARDNLLECARKLFALKRELRIPFPLPQDLEPWARACERGYQCLEFGNWPGVRAAYDEALGYRVQDAFVHHSLAFAFIELGESGDAVRAWLRVVELDSSYDFSRFGHLHPVRESRSGS